MIRYKHLANWMLTFALLCAFKAFAQQEEVDSDEQQDETVSDKIVDTLSPLVVEDADPVWLDKSQAKLAQTVQTAAQNLDDFFDDENMVDEKEEARTSGRWRLGWEPRSRDLSETEVRFKLKVKLPSAERKFDLFISDFDEEAPDTSVKAVRHALQPREERINLGVRYRRHEDSKLAFKAGIGRRAQLYVKSTYDNGYDISDKLNLKWNAAVYYYNQDGLGADAGFTFDYAQREDGLWRFDNAYFYREDEMAWSWEHKLQYFEKVNEKNALSYNAIVQGRTEPNYRIEITLLTVRWRFNAVRDWLFFEVEPFMGWRRDEDFDPSYGIGLRVDGYFGE